MLIDKVAELLHFISCGRYRYDKKVRYVSGKIFSEPESIEVRGASKIKLKKVNTVRRVITVFF